MSGSMRMARIPAAQRRNHQPTMSESVAPYTRPPNEIGEGYRDAGCKKIGQKSIHVTTNDVEKSGRLCAIIKPANPSRMA